MLKIVRKENSTETPILDLEGQVIGPWVQELDRVCEPILARGAGLSLDLSSVSFVSEPRSSVGRTGRVDERQRG